MSVAAKVKEKAKVKVIATEHQKDHALILTVQSHVDQHTTLRTVWHMVVTRKASIPKSGVVSGKPSWIRSCKTKSIDEKGPSGKGTSGSSQNFNTEVSLMLEPYYPRYSYLWCECWYGALTC